MQFFGEWRMSRRINGTGKRRGMRREKRRRRRRRYGRGEALSEANYGEKGWGWVRGGDSMGTERDDCLRLGARLALAHASSCRDMRRCVRASRVRTRLWV